MDFVQLRVVLEIQSAGSLSKAAMRLNKSQTFVSRSLADFEREFGGRIFYRNGRGVVPTELGERILPLVLEMTGILDRMVDNAATSPLTMGGGVKIRVSTSVSDRFVTRLFTQVKKDHPLIRLQFDDGESSEIDSALDRSEIDVAVFLRNGSTVGPRDEPICVYDICLVGPANDPFLNRSEVLFRELEDLPLLIRSEPSLLRTTVNSLAAAKGISLMVEAEVNSPRGIQLLLESGAGYLVAPVGRNEALETCAIGKLIQSGALKAVRICDPFLTRTLVVASNPSRGQRVGAVCDAAVNVLKAMMRGSEVMAEEQYCVSTLGASAMAANFMTDPAVEHSGNPAIDPIAAMAKAGIRRSKR